MAIPSSTLKPKQRQPTKPTSIAQDLLNALKNETTTILEGGTSGHATVRLDSEHRCDFVFDTAAEEMIVFIYYNGLNIDCFTFSWVNDKFEFSNGLVADYSAVKCMGKVLKAIYKTFETRKKILNKFFALENSYQ